MYYWHCLLVLDLLAGEKRCQLVKVAEVRLGRFAQHLLKEVLLSAFELHVL